ncbi:MAG: hypothetical protein EXR70_05425 [Deltaproteobacteria bacterium]|nr:hypothetical protein [Deltaproteobacteria bacterium]
MSHSTDYAVLLDLFIRLVQSQAGKKIETGEEWLNDAQTLSIKLFRHLVSMQTLATGTTVKHNNPSSIFFIDHASVKVVARAALETYLVFYYLYGTADRRDISEFRHKTWRLGGLIDRQQFHVSTDEHRQVLAREKQQIDALKSEIEAAPQFQEYTPKQRDKLLEGDWRIGNGWSDLGVKAGFHKQYFKEIYGYLCGYSHSSYASALQVGQAEALQDQQRLTKFILSIGVVIMAHFAFSYADSFSSAGIVLASCPDAKRVAEQWHFGPDLVEEVIYNRKPVS